MAVTYERSWETKRGGGGRSVADESRDSYYGVPAIHRPQWRWLIVLYFFLGGLAGASYFVASLAHLFGGADRENERITRAGRYLSMAALIPCPLLLILDLGRPERFHHMLRVFKVRSPMSVGTWGLTVFGGCCTLSGLHQAARDGLFGRATLPARLLRAVPGHAVGLLGTIPAFFVSGYTGVLLAATAVPLWTKNYLLMGPLFLASAASNATAAIALLLSLARGTSERTLRRLERLDSLALLGELALLLTVQVRLGPVLGRPLREGRLGRLHRVGVLGLGLGAPLALQAGSVLRGRAPSRLVTRLASLLVLAGGLTFRYVIVLAGQHSADDPRATFALAKADGWRAE